MLTYEAAVRFASELVEERGDQYAYAHRGGQVCYYVPTTDPRLGRQGDPDGVLADGPRASSGCFVGEILKKAGLLTDEIARSVGGVLDLVGALAAEPKALRFLTVLQDRQDVGDTWAVALAVALRS